MSSDALALNGSSPRTPAQKRLDRAVSKEQARAAFWRMIRLVYPHRRRMAIGLLLSLVAALAYAASLGGMLPVLKVLVEQENTREWLLEKAPLLGLYLTP